MNARTLIITAGALVALAAPAVASAKLSPAEQYQKSVAAKQHAAKPAKQVFKRRGQSRKIYIYYPAPAFQGEKSLAELQAESNAELIAYALDPVQFADTSTAPATTDDTSSTASSDNSSSTSTPDSTSTSDTTSTANATFAAAPAMPLVDDSNDC